MEYAPILRPAQFQEAFHLHWGNGLLLRSTNWLGDALMTLPAAYQASRLLPEACGFFVLCPSFLVPLWRACPWVDIVVGMTERRITSHEVVSARELCAGVGLVFPNSFGSALDIWKCGTPARVGRRGRLRTPLLTHKLPEWPRTRGAAAFHQLSYYLELVASLGDVAFTTEYPALNVEREPAERLGVRGGGWLALAPGAAYGPAKQWPAEHFLAVAKWHAGRGGHLVLVGTAKEKAVAAWLAERVPGTLDLTGQTSLAELMSVLASVRCVLANDSGAMHLAAALGTRGVAVFGSTDPVATGPIGAPWRILASSAPCRPCFRRECPLAEGAYKCLKGITPEEVQQELEALDVS